MVVSCPANKVEEHGLAQGDMLFTPSSETPEDTGVSAVVMEDLVNTVYSCHITRFRMRDEISLRYRKYLCNHPRVLCQFSRLCKGTTRQILVREDFKSAWVAIPPAGQHDRIAGYLDEATGKADRLVALRRRQMELLREQRAALIQQAVTRGLNPNAPSKTPASPGSSKPQSIGNAHHSGASGLSPTAST
ncbi:MAG: restriction endonuclease subunit S [Pedosphaera sp.]|nr:restriction endonuclease subunit S [Pedosphaera sp.]